jgi:TRAP transporter TAXI family solute receptor
MFVKQRSRRLTSLLVAAATGILIAPSAAQVPPPETQRISFQIATGPVVGTYLRVGEAIARIISNPPGLARCEVEGVCGPQGLIATSRSSSGSIANAISVDGGRVKSAIVQADIAAAAFAGEGPFKETGALKHLRAIARLHDETLHLVVAPRSRIKRLGDLKGKRVSIDTAKSATNYTVRSVLGAANIPASRLRLSFQSADQAARDLREGRIDAFFVIGVAPVKPVDGLVRRGQARIIGIDSRVVTALARKSPMLGKTDLPADTYRGSRQIVTLSVASLWVVNESLPSDLVQAILRSLWHRANRAELRRLGALARTIDAAKAAENLPLPLHEGAARFYAEAGR